jgi:hypothetical protein
MALEHWSDAEETDFEYDTETIPEEKDDKGKVTKAEEKVEWQKPFKGGELATTLSGKVDALASSPYEQNRRSRISEDLATYVGRDSEGTGGALFLLSEPPKISSTSDRLAFNLVFGKTNTIRNRICSFRPRGQFLPSSGDREAEQGAEDATSMCDAWMKAENYWAHASLATRDRLTMPAGVIKVYREGARETERVRQGRFPCWEFLVDPADAIYGDPTCLYHVRLVAASQAARQFGVKLADISSADTKLASFGIDNYSGEKMVVVIDAYQRGPDGRHVMMVGDLIMIDEEWEHDGFPITKKVYDESETGLGWDGLSMLQVLRPLQEEVTEWEKAIRQAHHMTSQQVWIVDEEDADSTKFNNEHVRILPHKSGPGISEPKVINPPAVNSEMYQYYKTMSDAADALIGVSPFSQNGTGKPSVVSKVAMREESEQQTDRLALESQKNEEMAVEVTTWWLRMMRDMCRTNPAAKPKWKVLDRGAWRELVFGDLTTDWEIAAFPTSLFGTGVSGQLDKAGDLIQQGWLTREDAMRALHIPDISPIIELELSETAAMQEIVDRILRDGEYTTPDPFLCDLQKLNVYAAKRYRLAFSKRMNYTKDNMAKLRRLIRATGPKRPGTVASPGSATGSPVGGAPGATAGPVAPVSAVPGAPAPTPPTVAPGALVGPPGATPVAPAPGAPVIGP